MPMPGTYVLAVSGGVDSMAMLHHLHQANPGNWKLVVAHMDHGIRQDSAVDRRLVQAKTKEYGLPFVYKEASLGAEASEALARQARYDFLRQVQRASDARAVVTAHHQDDLLETAIINILRGTGRKGLTALNSRQDTVRPLLDTPKEALIAYAKDQGLVWREDSTNKDQKYLRNYIRARLMPQLNADARQRLLEHIDQLSKINQQLDKSITSQLMAQSSSGSLDRQWFGQLPHIVAREVMASWLRVNGLRSFDRRTLERLVIAAKTSQPNRRYPVIANAYLRVNKHVLALELGER